MVVICYFWLPNVGTHFLVLGNTQSHESCWEWSPVFLYRTQSEKNIVFLLPGVKYELISKAEPIVCSHLKLQTSRG